MEREVHMMEQMQYTNYYLNSFQRMDSAQRKKLHKRSTKRQFKESAVLNLYILILSILPSLFEIFRFSTILLILKPLSATLLCVYIFTKLPQTRTLYILAKAFYLLNLLRQVLLLFHEEDSPTKLFFYITLTLQQTINIIILKQQFCSTQISILSHITLYLGALGLIIIQTLLVREVHPYIRINQASFLYFIAVVTTLPPILSLFRYRYTTSRSFWFCLIGNILLWIGLNVYCYQELIGEKEGLFGMVESLAKGIGNFVLMHGFVLHFMFRRAILREDE